MITPPVGPEHLRKADVRVFGGSSYRTIRTTRDPWRYDDATEEAGAGKTVMDVVTPLYSTRDLGIKWGNA